MVKKTEEELQAELDKSLDEIEKTPEPDPLAEGEPEVKEEAPEAEPETPKEEPEDKELGEDYKKKFVDSRREALILHSKNKKISEAIEAASSMPEPTEDELKIKYKDWDMMDDTQRQLATDNYKNSKALSMLGEVTKESKDIESWNNKVDDFVDNPKTLIANPLLEGKTDDFRIFASKPTRRGVPMEDLISAFLFEASKKVNLNKGKMFEVGTPGPSSKTKAPSDKISIEEAMTLKKVNYKAYKEKLLEGKIEVGEL